MPRAATILVATDLTRSGDAAVARAAAIARARRRTLVILHVVDIPDDLGVAFPSFLQHVRGVIERGMRRSAAIAKEAGVRARLEVREGRPAPAIAAAARTAAAELIVVGPHARSALRDAVLGSTAARLLRTTKVPVLIARGGGTVRKALLMTDLSPASAAALRGLAAFAPSVTNVEAIYCIAVPEYAGVAPESGLGMAVLDPLERAAADQLQRFLAHHAPGKKFRTSVIAGPPARVGAERARRGKVGLIAVGTQGRSRAASHLLGSTAESLVWTAPCDVLAVPPGFRPKQGHS